MPRHHQVDHQERGQRCSSCLSAAGPEVAVRTSYPSRATRRERTERRVRSSSTSRMAGRTAGSIVRCRRPAHDGHDGRPQDDDEDRGEDAADHREEHLDRCLGRRLLGALAALDAQLLRLDLQHLGDRHAELLGLDDGADEVAHRLGVRPGYHVAQRLASRATHADLGERLPELVDQRALHLLDDLGQRGVEAEAGLDRDGQQVERVGQLQDHGHRARADPAAQPELGRHVADARRHDSTNRSRRRAPPRTSGRG